MNTSTHPLNANNPISMMADGPVPGTEPSKEVGVADPVVPETPPAVFDGSASLAGVVLILCAVFLWRTLRETDRFVRDQLAWKRAVRAGRTAEAAALLEKIKATYPGTDVSHPSFRV